jgi:hypothetical protein
VQDHIRQNPNFGFATAGGSALARTHILLRSRFSANRIYFGLKLLSPLSAIEEAEQNSKFFRQVLGTIELWALMLSGEQHVSAGDAHRRLRI